MNDPINGFQRDDLERLKKELNANPDTGDIQITREKSLDRWHPKP